MFTQKRRENCLSDKKMFCNYLFTTIIRFTVKLRLWLTRFKQENQECTDFSFKFHILALYSPDIFIALRPRSRHSTSSTFCSFTAYYSRCSCSSSFTRHNFESPSSFDDASHHLTFCFTLFHFIILFYFCSSICSSFPCAVILARATARRPSMNRLHFDAFYCFLFL